MIKSISPRQYTLEWPIHLISWLFIFGSPIVFMDRNSDFDSMKCLFHSCASLCYFILFYLNYFQWFPSFCKIDKDRNYLLINLLLIIILEIALQLLHNYFFPSHSIKPPDHAPARVWFILRDITTMIFAASLGGSIHLSKQWRKTQKLLTEAKREKTEAELKNLKNQLNPHFLLNTLNNIYSLIAFDSEKAQMAVWELSKLLRYVLYDNQANMVPLEKELDFIRNYVALMRIRISQQVEVKLQLHTREHSNTLIAPLIFISLIENAFKHGISSTHPSFIDIAITETDQAAVRCVIRNSNYPKNHQDKSGSGIGLEQVQRRLDLLYPGQYEWSKGTDEEQKVYTSTLIIYTTTK